MNIENASKLQKKGMMIHQYVFLLFIIQRISLQFINFNLPWLNTIIMVSFVLLFSLIEKLLERYNLFNSIIVLRYIRFIQCIICSIIIIFADVSLYSSTSIYAMLMLFAVDFLLTIDSSEKLMVIVHGAILESLIFIMIFIRMSIYHDDEWFNLLFSALIIGLVLIGYAFVFGEYIEDKNKELTLEKRKLVNIEEKNENILNMQEKLKNTNYMLNAQKTELKIANKHIKEANEEMKVQVVIMRHIASSFDFYDISERIVDSIMIVKKPVFCAVYIRRNVYHNKHRNYVIKSKNSNMDDVIKLHIEEIYNSIVSSGVYERTLHEDEIKAEMSFLREFYINSVYMKVLGSNNDSYGLFMIGDNHENMFNDNMSFYNAITAQSDIAIRNAQMYNDMKHMARSDGLTGVNNRIYFTQLFKETSSKIVAENSCMSVALFDIDKFKNVNDTYGHLAGDEVIKRVASVTDEYIEQNNGFICRYGGEEFVAVLPERDINAAEPIIKGLFEKLCEQIVTYNEFNIPISVSVGLTSYPELCDDTEQLLKRADWCMYYAKEHGRHQVKLDDGNIEKNI